MKIIKNLYKYFVQKIFIFIYGKIKIAPNKLIEEHLRIQKITIDKIAYKIFNIKIHFYDLFSKICPNRLFFAKKFHGCLWMGRP